MAFPASVAPASLVRSMSAPSVCVMERDVGILDK